MSEPQCPRGLVVIAGVPDNAIVIKADTFHSPDSFFSNSKGECKRSDFFIVAETEKKKVILFIEMKDKRYYSKKEVVQQLTGTRCLLSYCQEIGKAFWGKQDFLNEYAHRFISIGSISMPKRKTRIERQSATHDSPEKMMKIDWPSSRIEFNLLAGKI